MPINNHAIKCRRARLGSFPGGFAAAALALSICCGGPALSQTPENSREALQKKESTDAVDPDGPRPKIKLGKVPSIALGPRATLTKEKIVQITNCIARLADIDIPDVGYSSTIHGKAFLPLPDEQTTDAMLVSNHQLNPADNLRTLVAFGPDALPYLLDALDNATPTKLQIDNMHGDSMWFVNELWGNPVNELESKALSVETNQAGSLVEAWLEEMQDYKPNKSYTVKIGDLCLVAIGQIVGRHYNAVRYQPSGIVVINSPTKDAQLCEQVSKIWSSDDPVRKLFNSLLLDYATEGSFQDDSWDSWGLRELQIQAAMRLLYYFPRESDSLIADRLRGFDIRRISAPGKIASEDESAARTRREVANGVDACGFIKAVSWCPEPKVREAIRTIFANTSDIDMLLAALPGIEAADRDLIRNRLQAFLDELPAEEGGYMDFSGYNVLVALANRLGKDAAPVFERYLKNANALRCYTAAQALKRARGDWCIDILYRMLDDHRPINGHNTHWAWVIPLRVCDAAAETMSLHRPELTFSLEGEYKKLDEQIKTMRDSIAKKSE
jgi:hypothetical protein